MNSYTSKKSMLKTTFLPHPDMQRKLIIIVYNNSFI